MCTSVLQTFYCAILLFHITAMTVTMDELFSKTNRAFVDTRRRSADKDEE